jgi:hypothetical protein
MAAGDIDDPKDYGSIVRNNLMKRPDYRPYCGNEHAVCSMPRTIWNGEQFKCPECRWESLFPADFIEPYKARWHPSTASK